MITLRKLKRDDYGLFIRLNNSPDNLRWMESDKPYYRDDFLLIFNTNMVKWFVIVNSDFRKKESENVGLFTAYIHQGILNLGIIIDEKYRRKGYAKKAFQSFLKEADKNKMDTYLSCFSSQPAIKLYEDLGYIPTGVKKEIREQEYIYMKRKHL